jgi:hypothetical protein
VDALIPELRSRVQRVIDRMRHEYGHEVTIVETARSQERQDHLFDQGRSRPGAIVTWTRDSAHTHGAAADVIVDGSWENGLGFARLQEIAKEEGLRTLGMKDRQIIFREILPNALPPVIVYASVVMAVAILLESALAFLRLSDPNVASWGNLIGLGRDVLRIQWYVSAIPGLAILLTVLAVSLVGQGLNDALNPRLKGR